MAAHPDFRHYHRRPRIRPQVIHAYCAHQAHRRLYLPLNGFDIAATGWFRIHGKDHGMWGGLCHTKVSICHGHCYQDGTFDIVPLSPEARCSPTSVAAHTLYEKSRPDILPGPGGSLDLNSSQYEQLSDGRSVRVGGAQFLRSRELIFHTR